MFGLFEPLGNIRGFLESGGYVLWLIFFVSLCLWMLIIERYWYLRVEHPKVVKSVLEQWQQRSETSSWHAQRNASGDPKLMAGGISQALVTTMLGLIAAIPLILLHSIVSGKSKRCVNILEEQSAGIA